jgi:hypothetical protein
LSHEAWLSIGYIVLLAILVLAFIEYIYMRNPSDRGLELINDDSWWWLKRNSERVFNDAKTAQSRNTEVTVMWNRWRSTLFTWYPNVIAIGPAGSWPLWSVRTIIFYGLSVVLWLSYFYAFFRLRRSSAAARSQPRSWIGFSKRRRRRYQRRKAERYRRPGPRNYSAWAV